MKSFLLHEDTGEPEDNKKNDALHAFLRPLCGGGTTHDFEGSNNGLTIYLHVAPGDTIVMGGDGGVRVLEQDKPILVNKSTFPMVHMAMLTIEKDNGAHHLNRIHRMAGEPDVANLDEFEVPYVYGVHRVCESEDAIYALMMTGVENTETFIIGEQGEQEELIATLEPAIPGLRTAHALLNDWFNAWEEN